MGVVTFNEEVASPIPAARLWRAILDSVNLLPKVMPELIKSIEKISGDLGPGNIYQWNLTEGGLNKYLKCRIDTMDIENMTYSYTTTEGDVSMGNIESITYEIKVEASPDGGCKVTNVTKYSLKPGVQIDEATRENLKAMEVQTFKAVEAYLLENPHLYA